MSCILYSRASYLALAKSPTFKQMWKDSLTYYYDSPVTLAESFYQLNVTAFTDRYQNTAEDLQGAELDPEIDYEFQEFIKQDRTPCALRSLAAFWHLLSRIDYQCSDARNYCNLESAHHLRWAKEWTGRRMSEGIAA